MHLDGIPNYILNLMPKYVFYITQFPNKLNYIYVGTHGNCADILFNIAFLHHNFQLKLLTDEIGLDYPNKPRRFRILTNVLSTIYHIRFFSLVWTNEIISINTLINLYPAAAWYEREIWDLFGVHFRNNEDLRRILTDYGFMGHPLRKDFPLSGYMELSYDAMIDSIVYTDVILVQEYRNFLTPTPWVINVYKNIPYR